MWTRVSIARLPHLPLTPDHERVLRSAQDFPWAYTNELDTRVFGFNQTLAPYDTKDVRWALALATVIVRLRRLEGVAEDAAFAAHVVYALPQIEGFISRLRSVARRWCAVILFADPPQSRLFDFWTAVFGEQRRPNPCLPQLLDVLWSMSIYADVTMLEVPIWPLRPPARARNGLRRRLHLLPGSEADGRLERAMAELLSDWGDGVLGPLDRRPLQVAVAHWAPR